MGGVVIDRVRVHAADEGDVVGDRAEVGEELADFGTGFTEFLEAPLRAEAFELLALELGELLALGEGVRHVLAVELGQLGFVVEGFEVGWAAGHGEPDDAFGFGREVGLGENAGPAVSGGGGAEEIRLEERAEREGSEAETLEEGAAGQVGIHGGS